MNNNNRNNRRRGRGRQGGGNGSQLNRIDSRARGNAPQMLDKYKKLAQDAQHNGDRVQMEYYLQFADHYFRVIADNKARADEARGGRRDPEPVEDYGDDDLDFGASRRVERPMRQPQDEYEPAPRAETDEGAPGQEGEPFFSDMAEDRGDAQPRAGRRQPRRGREDGRGDRAERSERPERAERAERPERPERKERRGDKPAPRPRRPRKGEGDAGGIDSSILPPSIRSEDVSAGDSDDTLEAVG